MSKTKSVVYLEVRVEVGMTTAEHYCILSQAHSHTAQGTAFTKGVRDNPKSRLLPSGHRYKNVQYNPKRKRTQTVVSTIGKYTLHWWN